VAYSEIWLRGSGLKCLKKSQFHLVFNTLCLKFGYAFSESYKNQKILKKPRIFNLFLTTPSASIGYTDETVFVGITFILMDAFDFGIMVGKNILQCVSQI
jgi:hypothetical protein